MSDRYSVQERVDGVGRAGQARIGNARVLVVGAGGLGCAVLPLLAGAGVGTLRVVDPDIVELGNLHRQTLYRHADLGVPKAQAARATLRALNPEITVDAVVAALDSGNARTWVEEADVVVDAADQWCVTYALSDACQAAGKPLVSASAQGQGGYAGVFCGGAPSYRALFPEWPSGGSDCNAAGVLGPAVATLGSIQAHLVLALILGPASGPRGRLVRWDGARLAPAVIDFSHAPEPGTFWPLVSGSDIRPGDIVIDLRGAAESVRIVSPDARRVALEDMGAISAFLPGSRRIILACRSGLRAYRAARILQEHGHDNLALLSMGDDRWHQR